MIPQHLIPIIPLLRLEVPVEPELVTRGLVGIFLLLGGGGYRWDISMASVSLTTKLWGLKLPKSTQTHAVLLVMGMHGFLMKA